SQYLPHMRESGSPTHPDPEFEIRQLSEFALPASVRFEKTLVKQRTRSNWAFKPSQHPFVATKIETHCLDRPSVSVDQAVVRKNYRRNRPGFDLTDQARHRARVQQIVST